MDVATGAMGILLPKLLALQMEDYKLQTGVRNDIMSIERELRSMQAVLRKVAEVPRNQLDHEIRIWAGEVKELSYEMEDVVDSFLMDSEGSELNNLDGFPGSMKKMANLFKKGKARHQIADAIKDIKDRVQDLANRRARYKVRDITANSATAATVDPRLLSLYRSPTEIIGIEEERNILVKKLMSGEDDISIHQLKILCIFGFAGIGKTTLAKVVYDTPQAQSYCRAFVSVGHNPDLKRVLKDLLLAVGEKRHQDFNVLDEIQLIGELRKLLEKKRYLIVVDDIWDVETWEIIRSALVDHNCGSIVIITTRILEVAKKAGEVFKLEPLSHEESEVLFYQRLFGGKGRCPDQLAEVSKHIIQKCRGIPLAIITMTGLLANKPWEDWSAVYNSVGFGAGDNISVENTRKIYSFSYYDLPSHLRTCLLYLSIFPEDYMIRKETLIWKWIAEGFVLEEPGIGLFELGERCFNELIDRSLVQPVEIPHSGIIIGCRVHDMVLDMICSLSAEENFVTILDSHEQYRSPSRTPHRLAIQNRVVQENEMLANSKVRSFNATKCEVRMMQSISSFHVLRVLALEGCTFIAGNCHLEDIGKLLHLRYLGLLNTPIYELTEKLGDLHFLLALDLRETKIEELPHRIVRLKQLKCLRGGSRSLRVPDGIGNLASLEELQLGDVSSSQNFLKELGQLTELRDLKLWIRALNKRSKKDLVESLGNLQKIQILQLDGGSWSDESDWDGYVPPRELRHLILGIKCCRLPAWINSSLLPNLSHLSVAVKVVEEQDLINLGRLPNLLTLSLFEECVCFPDTMRADAFPMLKHCYATGMLRFQQGAAPRLESINFNVRLWASKDTSFDPEFGSLGNLPSLQEVRVEIFYTEAQAMEVDELEAALRHVVDTHPNRPVLAISKWKSSVPEQSGSQDDEDGNEYYDDNEEDDDHEYYDDEE